MRFIKLLQLVTKDSLGVMAVYHWLAMALDSETVLCTVLRKHVVTLDRVPTGARVLLSST